jgi:hypothetical protein
MHIERMDLAPTGEIFFFVALVFSCEREFFHSCTRSCVCAYASSKCTMLIDSKSDICTNVCMCINAEYIMQAEVAIGDQHIVSLRFTTNRRVTKWLGIHFMPLCKTCAHTDACICVCVCVYKWYLQVHTCILGGAMRPRQVPKDVKRYVTISPLGREIVGLFSAAHLKWYQIGFITRLRMGDHSWRPMKRKGDENEVSDYGCASFPII